jgi:LPS-assembly protein
MLLQFTSDAGNLDYCDARYPSISSYEAPPDFPEDRRDKIDISADKTLSGKDGSSTFKGDVIVERHELRVRADSARFDKSSREISVQGNVRLDTIGMSLTADKGRFFLDDKNTEFTNIDFFIPETRLRGHADQVTAEGDESAQLVQSSITSCPPGDIDWLLSADTINLDLQDEYGKARNVVLRFHQVPFLYTCLRSELQPREALNLSYPGTGTSLQTRMQPSHRTSWTGAASSSTASTGF